MAFDSFFSQSAAAAGISQYTGGLLAVLTPCLFVSVGRRRAQILAIQTNIIKINFEIQRFLILVVGGAADVAPF